MFKKFYPFFNLEYFRLFFFYYLLATNDSHLESLNKYIYIYSDIRLTRQWKIMNWSCFLSRALQDCKARAVVGGWKRKVDSSFSIIFEIRKRRSKRKKDKEKTIIVHLVIEKETFLVFDFTLLILYGDTFTYTVKEIRWLSTSFW